MRVKIIKYKPKFSGTVPIEIPDVEILLSILIKTSNIFASLKK